MNDINQMRKIVQSMEMYEREVALEAKLDEIEYKRAEEVYLRKKAH